MKEPHAAREPQVADPWFSHKTSVGTQGAFTTKTLTPWHSYSLGALHYLAEKKKIFAQPTVRDDEVDGGRQMEQQTKRGERKELVLQTGAAGARTNYNHINEYLSQQAHLPSLWKENKLNNKGGRWHSRPVQFTAQNRNAGWTS